MTGETSLSKLLKELNPQLNEGEFVFVSVSADEANRIQDVDGLGRFKEEEGTTLIIERTKADQHNIAYESTYAWITLKVHSSLKAVGLTATFAAELAKHNISCNVVAGYYHDHIFVNIGNGVRAVQVLNRLAERH